MTAQLRAEGMLINHKKVMLLMREQWLTVRPRRRFVATTAATMGRSSRTSPRTKC